MECGEKSLEHRSIAKDYGNPTHHHRKFNIYEVMSHTESRRGCTRHLCTTLLLRHSVMGQFQVALIYGSCQ